MSALDYYNDLPSYGDWSPTSFDSRGLNDYPGGSMEGRSGWRVLPVNRNRDNESDPLTASNWAAAIEALKEVDPDGADHEAHSFNHWACGWFKIILVRPDTDAARIAGELTCALESYPVLDEEAFGAAEVEQAEEAWRWLDTRDRIRTCARHDVSIFAARRDELPEGLPCRADEW